ncbi:MAG: chromosomal replication initiator protein DnaA [Planctomycetota bacterium]|nr:chromosomal replication initiator protein DnaA [Planctomycetota bacterium]MDA1212367.1 chromosomal replication initiator protein DnaA [Planctomycetota bacterium]
MQTDSSTMMLSMQHGTTDPARSHSNGTNPSPLDLVQQFWQELQQQVGDRTFRHWFMGKTTVAVDGEFIKLGVASSFLLNWMQKKFQRDLELTAAQIWGTHARIGFVVHSRTDDAKTSSAKLAPTLTLNPTVETGNTFEEVVAANNTVTHTAPAAHDATFALPRIASSNETRSIPTNAASSTRQHNSLSKSLSGTASRAVELADFVVGRSNELAFTAVKQVSELPGARYNPLYIYGGVGIGKTHLLNGLAKELRRQNAGLQILLLTAENFANAFTQGLREKSLPSFRQRFRSVDVLLVDDIDFLDNKRVMQEEFLHTLKHLEAHGKQVVLTSDRHPRLLTHLNEELVTRFLSGVVCRLESPDADTRLEIVRRKVERMKLDLSPEVEAYVAGRFQANIREIEGALFSLQAVQSLTNKRISLTMAKKILSELERDCLRVIRLADIEQAVCHFFGVPADDLKSPRRSRKVSQPRMLAMFLARKLTTAAYSEIGNYFGGRNHSTVVSAEQRVQTWLDKQEDCQVAARCWSWGDIIENLEQQLSA